MEEDDQVQVQQEFLLAQVHMVQELTEDQQQTLQLTLVVVVEVLELEVQRQCVVSDH